MFLDFILHVGLLTCLYVTVSSEEFWPCPEEFRELSDQLDGDILLPGDEYFDETKQSFVNNWPGDYVAVARPKSEDDIRKLLVFAGDNNMPVSLYSTGYDYRGRSTRFGEKTFQISLKEMKDMEVIMNDPENNNDATLTVQTGNTFIEIYEKVHEYGKFVNGPNCIKSGPGGWYLGGGSSKFTSIFGLGVDDIILIKVITAEGETLEVRESGVTKSDGTEQDGSDLWWALRGGGGGIGAIVLSYKIKLYNDPGIVVYEAKYPIRATTLNDLIGETILNDVSAFLMDMPENWGGQINMDDKVFSPSPDQINTWPEETQFSGSITLNMVFFGVWDDAKMGYEMLKSIQPDWILSSQAINYTNHYDYVMAEGFQKDGDYRYLGGTLLQDEDFQVPSGEEYTPYAEIAGRMFDVTADTSCVVNIIGGHAKTFDASKYAVSANYRNARGSLFCWLQWKNEEDSKENTLLAQSWFNGTLYTIGEGKYLNKAEPVMPLDWKTEYWGPIENYNRLLAVKQDVDPENLLGCAQCVGYDSIPSYSPKDCPQSVSSKGNMDIIMILLVTVTFIIIMENEI